MSINPYQDIESASGFQIYEFYSVGKETLKKRVRFDLVDSLEQIYNLALCTVSPDGEEDCENASRNGDMDRVLETVAQIAIIYTNRYPERKIFFRGSDIVRTRKYQIGIVKYLDFAAKDFDIEGVTISEQNEIITREAFRRGENYNGFIFIRK